MHPRLASLGLFALASVLACTPPALTPTVYPPSSPGTHPLPDVTLDQCGAAPAAGMIYLEGQVTRRPAIIHPGEVRYPDALRAQGVSGRVKFAFVIDSTGLPVEGSLRTLEATDPAFVDAGRTTLLGSTFIPAALDGHPVAVCTAQTINFRQ